jgi:hypothetical protein
MILLSCCKCLFSPKPATKIEHDVMEAGRLEQHSEEFKKGYAQRDRVEGTISQGVRGYELRRSRYLGLKDPSAKCINGRRNEPDTAGCLFDRKADGEKRVSLFCRPCTCFSWLMNSPAVLNSG